MHRQLAPHQMAEGFLRAVAGDEFNVLSAGSEETPLDPNAVAAMSEVGVDISGHEPKAANRYLGRRFTYVVTLCDREKERSCPIFSGGDLTLALGSGRPLAGLRAWQSTRSHSPRA